MNSFSYWCGLWPVVSAVLSMWQTHSHGLQKSGGEKGQHGHSLSERAPCLDRLLLLSGSITSKQVLIHYAQVCFKWSPFTDNKEKDVADYYFPITKKNMLQMQGKKVVELVTPLLLLLLLLLLLRRFSTDFRKLLQRFALNICYLNSGWGSLGRGKPQRGLGIMQAWFPMGKPICGPGSCVPPRACLFSEPGLSYIHHCHGDQFPINYVYRKEEK